MKLRDFWTPLKSPTEQQLGLSSHGAKLCRWICLLDGLFLRGCVQEAFATFDKNIDLAIKMKALNLATSYKISKSCYLSQISIDPIQAIANLKAIDSRLGSQEMFSRGAIQLEIFRQLINCGSFNEALELFSTQSPHFYESKNRRQIATLLHRYAHLQKLQGANIEALTILRTSRINLVEQVDRIHLLRSFGLELKILKNSKNSDPAQIAFVEENLTELEFQIPTFIGRRIQNRNLQVSPSQYLKVRTPWEIY